MGNSSSKNSNSENSSSETPYDRLTRAEKRKLNDFFKEIILKASVDYDNKEIQDIQSALLLMLDRATQRINERGIFSVARIQPCGSMSEKTSMFKTRLQTKETYTEFDMLAVLKGSAQNSSGHSCPGCVVIEKPPINLACLEEHYSGTKTDLEKLVAYPDAVTNMFLQELTWCFTSSCKCLSVEYADVTTDGEHYSFLFKPGLNDHGCDKCIVDMPTGTLQVNTSVVIEPNTHRTTPAKCSLILLWKSKAKSIFAPLCSDLQETVLVDSFPIYLDVLPALEYTTLGNKDTDTCGLLVPKHCNLKCGRVGWRISESMSETNFIVNRMTNKHRNCYKVMKYLTHLMANTRSYLNPIDINSYHVKIAVIRHSWSCFTSSEDCAECILKIFHELQWAYESQKLKSLNSEVNLLEAYRNVELREMADHYDSFISKLCSVTECIDWNTYAVNLYQPRYYLLSIGNCGKGVIVIDSASLMAHLYGPRHMKRAIRTFLRHCQEVL